LKTLAINVTATVTASVLTLFTLLFVWGVDADEATRAMLWFATGGACAHVTTWVVNR
jgi:hypothetical protein